MNYLYIDGDNIGLKIESNFLINDEASLVEINNRVKDLVQKITEYLIANNLEIVFSGADGIICKGISVNLKQLQDFARSLDNDITFSIGSGKSLKDAYIALRYAKAINKNVTVILDNQKFTLIR